MTATKTTTKPAAKTASKAATSAAPKATQKPVQKAAQKPAKKHLTVQMIATLSAQAATFIARGIKYHGGRDRLHVTKEGVITPTASGRAFFESRVSPDLLAAARKSLQSGEKMATGATFVKSPDGFVTPYVIDNKFLAAGRSDSQAVFSALMTV